MKNQYILLTLILASFAPSAPGQMTVDQKAFDFTYLASLYAKNYAPYEWKRDVMGFDLYNVKPWLDRVKASKDDLEFYDICVRYVASLQDSHNAYRMQSDFWVYLPFEIDIYDGKVLFDQIYRGYLPKTKYPINIGDELVSVDGKPALELADAYAPYAGFGAGNLKARRRMGALTSVSRYQLYVPRAPETGESATIVVRDLSGAQTTYVIPWNRQGTPILTAGLVPSPNVDGKSAAAVQLQRESNNPWGARTGGPRPAPAQALPPYLKTLRELQRGDTSTLGSVKLWVMQPGFGPPAGFRMRLGAGEDDWFLSGTFPVGQHRVGLLRFPDMGTADAPGAPQELASEIAYLQANTDALVIDLMHNPGGSNCYAENAAQYLITTPFRGVASRLRANQFWLNAYALGLSNAIADNAPPSIITLYSGFVSQIQAAMKENRALTGPLPICTGAYEAVPPAMDEQGNVVAYTKPILVLVDEFTASSAETLAMFLQDEGRATILGVRTNGAGGNPQRFNAGAYSEGHTDITLSMVTRKRPVSTPGFPTADHLENVGIYPDIVADYMTRENLLAGGRPFVQAFSQAVADLIARQ